MKRIFYLIFLLTTMLVNAVAQTPRYLVNTIQPDDVELYQLKKTGSSMNIGGEKWGNGFTIGRNSFLIAPKELGHAVFKIGGQYEKLTFFLGAEMGSGDAFQQPKCEAHTAVVAAYVDGVKIMEQKIKQYDVGQRVELNVKGAKEARFEIVLGEVQVAFAEVVLWKTGETCRETGGPVTSKPVKKQLVKDLKPYCMTMGHRCVSPDSECKSVGIGNKEYDHGIVFDMSMAISGNNSARTYFNLRGQFATLTFLAGPVNAEHAKNGSGWVTVEGDGKILHEYEVSQGDIAQQVTINVKGVRQLVFLSEQTSMSMDGAVVDAWVYPEGESPAVGSQVTMAKADPRLKSLPSPCKLISNIPPYAARSSVEQQVFDGKSDYITFSMGGTRFNEGVILFQKASFWDENTISYAAFDIGNEFDYVSFTVGFIGKSWAMTNDVIRVYADNIMVKEIFVFATMPNLQVIVPVNKCRKLRIENGGSGKMNVGAYGVADLVVYRGEPVANQLFVHPRPNCPSEIDLIDLGSPYVHYVSNADDNSDNYFYDGSTQRRYVTMRDGSRLNKCFLLKTNSHFSLDHGVLSDMDGAMAATAGAVAAGVSFVPVAAAGTSMIGSTLAGMAAFVVLAAGGTALENSCAAFNLYGEYNSLTFKVACLRTKGESQLLGPDYIDDNADYKETLLIGCDQEVKAKLTVYESMEPQIVTVPVDGCHQLLFWLANTNNSSALFVFYDLKLSKERCNLNIPKDARLSEAVVTTPAWTNKFMVNTWIRPKSSGVKCIDEYLVLLSNTYSDFEPYLSKNQDNELKPSSCAPAYDIYTYYLDTDAGETCKAVRLRTTEGQYDCFFDQEFKKCARDVENLMKIKSQIASLTIAQASAAVGLSSLGLVAAVNYGKILKNGNAVLKELWIMAEHACDEKKRECDVLNALIKAAIDIDGKKSTEKVVFCPLDKDEPVPEGDRMLVRNFTL